MPNFSNALGRYQQAIAARENRRRAKKAQEEAEAARRSAQNARSNRGLAGSLGGVAAAVGVGAMTGWNPATMALAYQGGSALGSGINSIAKPYNSMELAGMPYTQESGFETFNRVAPQVAGAYGSLQQQQLQQRKQDYLDGLNNLMKMNEVMDMNPTVMMNQVERLNQAHTQKYDLGNEGMQPYMMNFDQLQNSTKEMQIEGVDPNYNFGYQAAIKAAPTILNTAFDARNAAVFEDALPAGHPYWKTHDRATAQAKMERLIKDDAEKQRRVQYGEAMDAANLARQLENQTYTRNRNTEQDAIAAEQREYQRDRDDIGDQRYEAGLTRQDELRSENKLFQKNDNIIRGYIEAGDTKSLQQLAPEVWTNSNYNINAVMGAAQNKQEDRDYLVGQRAESQASEDRAGWEKAIAAAKTTEDLNVLVGGTEYQEWINSTDKDTQAQMQTVLAGRQADLQVGAYQNPGSQAEMKAALEAAAAGGGEDLQNAIALGQTYGMDEQQVQTMVEGIQASSAEEKLKKFQSRISTIPLVDYDVVQGNIISKGARRPDMIEYEIRTIGKMMGVDDAIVDETVARMSNVETPLSDPERMRVQAAEANTETTEPPTSETPDTNQSRSFSILDPSTWFGSGEEQATVDNQTLGPDNYTETVHNTLESGGNTFASGEYSEETARSVEKVPNAQESQAKLKAAKEEIAKKTANALEPPPLPGLEAPNLEWVRKPAPNDVTVPGYSMISGGDFVYQDNGGSQSFTANKPPPPPNAEFDITWGSSPQGGSDAALAQQAQQAGANQVQAQQAATEQAATEQAASTAAPQAVTSTEEAATELQQTGQEVTQDNVQAVKVLKQLGKPVSEEMVQQANQFVQEAKAKLADRSNNEARKKIVQMVYEALSKAKQNPHVFQQQQPAEFEQYMIQFQAAILMRQSEYTQFTGM